MKVGIVGTGFVGSAAAYAMVMRGVGTEIVLLDKNTERAQAEANDIFHAVPFANPMRVTAGTYADLAGCRVVIIPAGVNQKPGETRLQLLERNAAVFYDVIPQVVAAAPTAILVIATNPVDVMTHLATHIAVKLGVPAHRVIGSGTTLDTARFRALIGQFLGVDAQHVHGYVIGEHGDSEVLTWSQVTVAGMPLADFSKSREKILSDETRAEIDDGVRRAAYKIIAGKGATYYGIGSALARITEVILKGQQALLTVCSTVSEAAGVNNVTLALPHLIGGDGVLDTFELTLTDQEQQALARSASIIRGAIDTLKLT